MPKAMEEIQTIHDQLCDHLNIDQSSAERSWEAYKSICVNYRLEVRIFLIYLNAIIKYSALFKYRVMSNTGCVVLYMLYVEKVLHLL